MQLCLTYPTQSCPEMWYMVYNLKNKTKQKKQIKPKTAIWFISTYYKCIKDLPSNAAEGSRTLRNIPLVCLRKVTHIAL